MKTYTNILVTLLAFALTPAVQAALTPTQRQEDFKQLAALYAKNYAPYEWKRDALGFDLYDVQPWLDRVARVKDDLEYYDICIEYVSRLQDGHVTFTLPSTFSASLGFHVDSYDGKVLIDGITRSRLPVAQYPFQPGDELVSVDGLTPEEYIRMFSKYVMTGNPDSTRRSALARIASRIQWIMPRATEIGDSAAVVVRRASGELETYMIPWLKTGRSLGDNGPVPNLKDGAVTHAMRSRIPEDDSLSPYLQGLSMYHNDSVLNGLHDVLNVGVRGPMFALPAGFVLRQGSRSSDFFFSGTYVAEGQRIGFIRIPSFAPPSASMAAAQFLTEIRFMEANTDGLIVDVMRNPGGASCFNEQLQSMIMPTPFRTLGRELRATAQQVATYANTLDDLRMSGAPDWAIRLYEYHLASVEQAFNENRGRTGPLPICGPTFDLQPMTNSAGEMLAYTKPMILLVDGFSASAGDAFAAVFQDNNRGLVVGERTMGLGGSVIDYDAGAWSESNTRVTVNLMNRKNPINTSDLISAPYVENIGVRPDVQLSIMTSENLLNQGRPFAAEVTRLAVEHIRKNTR